jgi:hypothetical protein
MFCTPERAACHLIMSATALVDVPIAEPHRDVISELRNENSSAYGIRRVWE